MLDCKKEYVWSFVKLHLSTISFFVFALSAFLYAEGGISFTGTLKDSLFANTDSLSLEILETGSKVQIHYGEPFHVTIPEDTLWNLCVTSPSNEECYEIKYFGSDSSFSMDIGNEGAVVRYDDGSEVRSDSVFADAALPNEASKDSLATDSVKDVDVDGLLASESAKMTEMKKVVVQLRRRPKRKPGESIVSAKSIKRMPGLAEADVIRSIQALPGVVASSDFSTKIYVRGGAADQNLFLYDNAVVYSPTHFFGLFSTFLVETIDGVQFYKSGFPAQYGNRLSSVLKMDGRAGGNDTLDEWFSKSSIKISTFAGQLHTEGHIGNSRWVVAGRTTYIGPILDLCNWIGLLDFNLDYGFTDLQGTYQYSFSEDTKIKASFYIGSDNLEFDPLYMNWGNMAIPINFYHRFGNFDYNATVSFSKFNQNMKISDLMGIGIELYTWSGKQWLNYRGIENHLLTMGYDLEYDDDLFSEYIAESEIADHQYPFHHVVYGQDSWQIASNMSLVYGLRLNYQTLANHFGIEPRASLTWNLDENKTLEFYGGHYLQYMNSIMFSDQESLNEFYYPAVTTSKGTHLKPASSNLFAIEYSHRNILDAYNATVGVYYKTQNNLNTFSMQVDSTTEEESKSDGFLLADYFGTADGYSMGYELSLRKDEGAWFGGINFSQSLSVIRSNDGTNAYFPSWHQPYALKIDAGINWKGDDNAIWKHEKKGHYFRSSIIMKYSAGMPYTEKAGYFYPNDINAPTYSDEINVISGSRNGIRQTNYFRIDVKAIDIGREDKWNFSWTIINLTDHENMFYSFYDTSENPPKFTSVSQFPFLPIMLNYEYYF